MALFGNNQNDDKPGSKNATKIKSKSRPHDCKTCGNPRARHPKGKCFEDPKNLELKKNWEAKYSKKWTNFKDYKKLISIATDDDDNEFPRFGGLTCRKQHSFVGKISDRWIPDTGASSHIANSLEKFDTYEEVKNLPLINTASGPVRPKGMGTVILQCRLSNGDNNPFVLKEGRRIHETRRFVWTTWS